MCQWLFKFFCKFFPLPCNNLNVPQKLHPTTHFPPPDDPCFLHSVFGGSGNPCARNAVRKCIFATFVNSFAPNLSTNSFAATSTAADAPFGNFIPYFVSNAPKRVTNSFLAKIDAAATAISSSALCL